MPNNQKELAQNSLKYEFPVAYVVEFPNDENPEQKLYSGYIQYFLNKTKPTIKDFKIDGPLIATTIMKMPFENLAFCLYAMMNILRSDSINYTMQNEKELVESKGKLELTLVTREDIFPGYNDNIKQQESHD